MVGRCGAEKPKLRRGVDGGGRRGLNAEGSEAAQERSNVSGVRER
jgi:hypothetical protein